MLQCDLCSSATYAPVQLILQYDKYSIYVLYEIDGEFRKYGACVNSSRPKEAIEMRINFIFAIYINIVDKLNIKQTATITVLV